MPSAQGLDVRGQRAARGRAAAAGGANLLEAWQGAVLLLGYGLAAAASTPC